MVARYSKFNKFQLKASVANHVINDFVADWDKFS